MNKIYQTRLGNLSTSVVVNGVPRRVQFRAWDGVNGLFSTEDEALQQALEADSGYGRVFRCITPVPKAKPEKPADESQPVEMQGAETEAAKMDDSQAESIAPVAAEAENAVPEVVSGVTNKQQAIEWLAANRGIDGLKPTCRAEAVRNAAALHGVSFPDWK